jgi:methyl-accepting chemotaxis protein
MKIKSIAVKMILPIILASTLIQAGFLWFNVNKEVDKRVDELNGVGNEQVTLLENAAKNPLWNYNKDDLEQLVEAISNDPRVAIVAFYDPQGHVMAMNDKEGQDKAYDEQYLHAFSSGEMTGTLATEIHYNGKLAGYLELVLTDKYIREEVEAIYQSKIIEYIIVIMSLLLIVYLTVAFITKSIKDMMHATDRVAEGDLSYRISLSTDDEIGQLAEKFNHMTEQLFQMTQNINESAHNIAASAEEMTASADESVTIVGQITEETSTIVDSAKDQVVEIDRIDQAIKEVTGYFEKLVTEVDSVSEISQSAYENTKKGEVAINNSLEKVININAIFEVAENQISALVEQSEMIGGLITDIDSITNRTKMLSLNASIEAARSGEAGKGFAVVAEEIKKLADQSEENTNQITSLVQEMLTSVHETVSAMGEVPKAIQESQATVEDANQALNAIRETTTATYDTLQAFRKGAHEQINKTRMVETSVSVFAENTTATSNQSSKILDNVMSQQHVVTDISSASSDLAQIAENMLELTSVFKV